MKYSSSNKPLVCMQTQSTCYKGTSKMTIRGILWHSTGANNPTLKRYVQPSDTKPAADTYSKAKWLELLGKNAYNNDWNHTSIQAGLNAWIGKLADGTVTSIQTMPWDFGPWGCGSGSKGSCNNGWIQFEICEDALTDRSYFNTVYKEACELTAYLCKLYNIDPNGTVTYNGVKVPTILCHYDSYKLGLGSNHGDVDYWFKKHGKSMATVRTDVATILGTKPVEPDPVKPEPTTKNVDIIYQTWDDVKNRWLPNVTNDSDYAGIFGNDVCAVYANLTSGDCVYKVHTLNGKWLPEVKNRTDYAGKFNTPIDGFMIKSTNSNVVIHYQVHTKGGKWLSYVTGYDTNDSTDGYAGILGKAIDGVRMYVEVKSSTSSSTTKPTTTVTPVVTPTVKPSTTTTEAKQYKVVTKINKYGNVTNAINKTNALGTYSSGTYYLYNKYPEGYKGMFNITLDKTGDTAGGWINPSENVLKESTPVANVTTTETKPKTEETQNTTPTQVDTEVKDTSNKVEDKVPEAKPEVVTPVQPDNSEKDPVKESQNTTENTQKPLEEESNKPEETLEKETEKDDIQDVIDEPVTPTNDPDVSTNKIDNSKLIDIIIKVIKFIVSLFKNN